MRKSCVRFRRKHKNTMAPVMIVAGLLLTLVFMPFWAFMALLGVAAVGVGVYCLISQ